MLPVVVLKIVLEIMFEIVLEFVLVRIVAVMVGDMSVPVIYVDFAMVGIIAAVLHPEVVWLVGMVGFVVVGVMVRLVVRVMMRFMVDRFVRLMVWVMMRLVVRIVVRLMVNRFVVGLVINIVDRLIMQVPMWFVLMFYGVNRVIMQVMMVKPVISGSTLAMMIAMSVMFVEMGLIFMAEV